MTAIQRDILTTLVELDSSVKAMKTAQAKPNLIPIFNRLDQLTHSLPKDTDPSLLHYLHKKSYEKALLYLRGRDAENAEGTCRH
jgi:hypothetical protein